MINFANKDVNHGIKMRRLSRQRRVVKTDIRCIILLTLLIQCFFIQFAAASEYHVGGYYYGVFYKENNINKTNEFKDFVVDVLDDKWRIKIGENKIVDSAGDKVKYTMSTDGVDYYFLQNYKQMLLKQYCTRQILPLN